MLKLQQQQTCSTALRKGAMQHEYLLIVQVLQHYQDFLQAQGGEAAVAAPPQQWRADFDIEAVPDIPEADLPPQPPKVRTRVS